jgi:hypothetical protein
VGGNTQEEVVHEILEEEDLEILVVVVRGILVEEDLDILVVVVRGIQVEEDRGIQVEEGLGILVVGVLRRDGILVRGLSRSQGFGCSCVTLVVIIIGDYEIV